VYRAFVVGRCSTPAAAQKSVAIAARPLGQFERYAGWASARVYPAVPINQMSATGYLNSGKKAG
jgi:hypothetical protein